MKVLEAPIFSWETSTMDTHASSDSGAPGSSSGSPFQNPDWTQGADPGRRAGAGSDIGRRSLIGRLASRWWQILLLSMVLSAPAVYLIYASVEPTYEAMSLLRVEPTPPVLFGADARSDAKPDDIRSYLRTQLKLMKSDRVLNAALDTNEISRLKMVISPKDAKADLRRDMTVMIVDDDTYLIRVMLSSKDPVEAAAIVNAVVDAYLDQHNRYQQTANRVLKKNLEGERSKLESQIQVTSESLRKLREKERVPAGNRVVIGPDGKQDGSPVESSLPVVTEAQYEDLATRLLQADFELMDAAARLETAKRPGSQASAEKVRELESAMDEARRKRLSYQQYVARLKVRSEPHNVEQVDAMLLTQDLQYLKRLQEAIKSRLAQIDFEISQEAYRVTVQDRAVAPKAPSSDPRIAYTVSASALIYLMILGAFLVDEITGRRPAEPNAAS
jgi:uncharacterized protein involved in exopolysaccharide biosynthesis